MKEWVSHGVHKGVKKVSEWISSEWVSEPSSEWVNQPAMPMNERIGYAYQFIHISTGNKSTNEMQYLLFGQKIREQEREEELIRFSFKFSWDKVSGRER